jgi:putative colanic acid biosysnthesis UDP-glucose lipid carrier transferase
VKVIYITLPIRHLNRVRNLLEELQDTTASIYYVPDIFVFDLIQSRSGDILGTPVVALCESPFRGYRSVLKRASDVIFTLLGLVAIFPLLLLLALVIRLTSPGPVIFKQRRYGLDGQEIIVYKFRSMYVTEDGEKIEQVTRHDPRITPVGRILRSFSLDELPQLINVLQGRMSLVGPRPHAVAHNEQYRRLIKGYMLRHKVLPGITGLAQVNGCRGETRTLEEMEARVRYDLTYLRTWTPLLDFKILLLTVVRVFRDSKAY